MIQTVAKLISSHGPALLLTGNRRKPDQRRNRGVEPDQILIPGDLVIDDGSNEANPEGIDVGANQLNEIIDAALENKTHQLYSLRLGDARYYLPTSAEIQQVLVGTSNERRKWIEERYDCDDFAYVLKAFSSSVAYVNGALRCGLALGIVWGNFKWLDGFHACNWAITAEKKLILIEPQTNQIYSAADCVGGVTFVAA